MSSIAAALGLHGAGPLGPSTSVPNYGPAYLIFNFLLAYGGLAPRHLKQYYGIDHNVSPREDLTKYGERAVRDGKLTQRQLNMIKRNESAQANTVENFTLFVAGVTFATFAGVPTQTINTACLTYTVARIAYGAFYILVETPKLSLLRSVASWVGNVSGLTLLWKAGNKLSV